MRDKTSSCVRKNLDFAFVSLGQLVLAILAK